MKPRCRNAVVWWHRGRPRRTVCVTPSPESSTIPVVLPEAYRDSTAWMATYMAGTLNVSNMICEHRTTTTVNAMHVWQLNRKVIGEAYGTR